MADNELYCPRVDVLFSPAWWHANYGMTFGESLWKDPIGRTELAREQARILFERFGDVGIGEEDPPPRPNVESYGHRFMSALWGCEILYLPDQAPSAIVLPDARERMAVLEVPDLSTSPIVKQAFDDAKKLRAKYGCCEGAITMGGPLNNAVSVLGEEILCACLTEPDLAKDVLRKMGEAVLAVEAQITYKLNGIELTSPRPGGGLGNCPVCMISPETYRDVVLPVDLWFRNQYKGFGLHHCGIFHPYAEVYRELNVDCLDVGWGTDLRWTRHVFPETPISLELQEAALIGKDQTEIDALLWKMTEDAAPSRLISNIWIADMGPEISDETVRILRTAPERLNGK